MADWTKYQIDELRKLRVDGESFEEIGRLLGHTPKACQVECTKHGIFKFGISKHTRHKAVPDGMFARPNSRPMKYKPVTRSCLCCTKKFQSYGFGNRLCNHCANQSISPYAF